jgi:alpha-ketoglutarate-dependent sulfate ester dioxygenase
MTTQTRIEVRPIAGHIGAEIHGVDLRTPLDPTTLADVRAAWLQWKVVFFRDQQVTPEQHIAFGRQLGSVTPAHPTVPPAMPEYPEILVLDNQQGGLAEAPRIESRWHTDVTFVPNPPMASILHGVVVPPYGGDTQWTNLVVAYERLSEPIRTLIGELHAVHHNVLPLARGEAPSDYQSTFQSRPISSVHPMVRVHPETGERAIFVNPNFTSHVVELSRQEGRHLLAMLYEHLANAEFTCRFRWEPDSIAMWDNRATAHLVPTDIPAGHRRRMQRITLAGDLPVGPDGKESYALSGDTFA